MPSSAFLSEQGQRWRMEDRHVLIPDFWQSGWILGAVFDGHRGIRAADYAAAHFPDLVHTALRSGQEGANALVFALENLGQDLFNEPSGSTAVVFLLQEQFIAVANVGDAQALRIQNGQAQILTSCHRVDNEDERIRIQEAGGRIAGSYVMHGYSGLMPTRSLGDAEFHQVGLTFAPYVHTVFRSQEDEWLIAACDGLFDVLSAQEVAQVLHEVDDAQDGVQRLGREVLEVRQGKDNLSIVAVDLRQDG